MHGRRSESVPVFREIAASAERVHGPDADFTLNVRSNLAQPLAIVGVIEEAEPTFRDVLDGLGSKLSNAKRSSPDLSRETAELLAQLATASGRDDEAREWTERAAAPR